MEDIDNIIYFPSCINSIGDVSTEKVLEYIKNQWQK